MEADRFQHNKKLFIIGILCLVFGLILFILSFYTLPNLVFNWRYQIPTFMSMIVAYLQIEYHLQSSSAGWLVFLGSFGISMILFVIADIMSNKIDGKIFKDYYTDNTQKVNKRKMVGEQDSGSLVFKIIFIIILVFIASQLFQWAISI